VGRFRGDLSTGCVRLWVKLVFPGIKKNWFYLSAPKGVWRGERLALGDLGLALASPSRAPAVGCASLAAIWGVPGDGDTGGAPAEIGKGGVCSETLCGGSKGELTGT